MRTTVSSLAERIAELRIEDAPNGEERWRYRGTLYTEATVPELEWKLEEERIQQLVDEEEE